jgi:hypothetical protein
MFGNDHLLWLLESHLDEIEGGALKELDIEDDADLSITNNDADSKKLQQKRIAESKENTVEGVIPEDLPDITESFLAKDDFYKTLC